MSAVQPAPAAPVSATVGLAMRALMATGHYDETDDAFQWLMAEAADVVDAIGGQCTRAAQIGAVVELLTDTGFHDVSDPGEAACLRSDATTVVTAVTAAMFEVSSGDGNVDRAPIEAARPRNRESEVFFDRLGDDAGAGGGRVSVGGGG